MSRHHNLEKLPEIAFADNPYPDPRSLCRLYSETDAPVIAIKRGEHGYYAVHTRATADELNAAHGVSAFQREAMLAGSMFGWNAPSADPDLYAQLACRGAFPAAAVSAAA